MPQDRWNPSQYFMIPLFVLLLLFATAGWCMSDESTAETPPSTNPWSTQPNSSEEAASSNPWGTQPDSGKETTPANAWSKQSDSDKETSWLDDKSSTVTADKGVDWMHPFQDALVPLDSWVNDSLSWVVDNFRPLFQAIRVPIDTILVAMESLLTFLPDVLIIFVLTLLARVVSGWSLSIGTLVSLLVIGFIGAWAEAMVTLSLVLTAVFFCLLLGLPLGIWLSQSDRALQTVRPILDAMQTTPAFVYLVPIVMLFGIGNVPGVVVTIIFALPPLIRLTNLGIRQVPEEPI